MVVTIIERPLELKSRYFLAASCLALAVTLVGFFKTFILPSACGAFNAPAIIYIHGSLLFLWVVFLLIQSTLIRMRKPKVHRPMGFLSIGLIPCVVISTMTVGVYALKSDLARGGGRLRYRAWSGRSHLQSHSQGRS